MEQTLSANEKVIPDYPTIILFVLITIVAIVGVPAFGYFYGYSTVDWVMMGGRVYTHP